MRLILEIWRFSNVSQGQWVISLFRLATMKTSKRHITVITTEGMPIRWRHNMTYDKVEIGVVNTVDGPASLSGGITGAHFTNVD